MSHVLIFIIEAILGKLSPLGASSTIELAVTLLLKGVTLVSSLFKPKQKQGSATMNPLFKAILKEVSDLVSSGEAIVAKSPFATLLPLLLQAGEDAPAIVSNWSDLKAEALALISNPAADADLLSYATSLVGGAGTKATQIITATATLVLSNITNVSALVTAIKS